mgnify:CR=1 FL=1
MSDQSIKASLKQTGDKLKENIVTFKKPLIAIALVIGGVTFYSMSMKSGVTPTKSSVNSAPEAQRRMTGDYTDHYREEVTKSDNVRLEQAKSSSDSYIPSIIEANKTLNATPKNLDDTPETGNGDLSTPPDLPPAEAPHVDVVAEQPQTKTTTRASAHNQRYVDPQRIAALQEMLQAHLNMDTFTPGAIMTAHAEAKAADGSSSASDSSQSGPVMMSAGTPASYQKTVKADDNSNDDISFRTPVPGTILSGHFASEVDSRVPGVVMGVIDSGAFSGARIMGSFQTSQSKQLMVKFTGMTVTYEDDSGETRSKYISINALAVDPKTLSQGMATYVNTHMFAKVASTLATSFMQGIGEAIQQSGSSAMMSSSGGTVISEGTRNTTQQMLQAGGQAAQSIGSLLSQNLNSKPDTILIAQGTHFGLLFVGGANGDAN